MKRFFGNYKIGFDLWGFILFAVLMIPNIVYWCLPAFNDLGGNALLDFIALFFEVPSIVFLIVMKRKHPERRHLFDSLYIMTAAMVLFYYVAWIVYFCGFNQLNVILFLTVCPCAALLLYELERKNLLALFPTAVFSVLHIVSAFI